jgi:hypothetical protein
MDQHGRLRNKGVGISSEGDAVANTSDRMKKGVALVVVAGQLLFHTNM